MGVLASGRDWLSIWSEWDAGWYTNIAHNGYTLQPGEQSSVAFAPGLPLLMHTGGLVVGTLDPRTLVVCGLAISNLALLVALVYLEKLVEREFDAPTARRTVLYVLVWPSTLFLSALYPHALLLAAAIPSLYYARQGRWWLAGVLGGLAALMRTDGALLVVPLAFEYVRRRRLRSDVLALALVPLGWLLFAAYLYGKFGSATVMFSATEAWQRQLAPPWAAFVPFFTQPMGPHGSNQSPLDLAMALILCGLVALTWVRLERVYAIYATTFGLAMLSTGLLVSTMRYGLELFPVFIVLALSGRYRAFHYAFVVVAGAIALRFMTIFAAGGWIA